MNVSEAQDFHTLLHSVTTSATDDQKQAGVVAAERLTKRARAALDSGPVAPQVAALVTDLQDAVRVAADDEEWMVHVSLGARPMITTAPAGGVL